MSDAEREAVEREVQILTPLAHPNIIRVLFPA